MKLRLLTIRQWLADKTKPYTNSIKEFMYDVFAPSKLAYVKFTYLEQYKKQNPVPKQHIVLAKVRRTASAKEIAEVFNLDAPPKVTYTIKDVKVLPITKLPRV